MTDGYRDKHAKATAPVEILISASIPEFEYDIERYKHVVQENVKLREQLARQESLLKKSELANEEALGRIRKLERALLDATVK